jgi:multidrug efflux pump subunit AcrA (membrane-fusion protein)
MRRLILLPLLVTIAVVGIVGGIGVWVFNEFNFYTTNDALVEGKVDAVSAPQAGILTNLNVKKGDTVQAGNQIATLNLAGNNGGSQVNINSPANGTILLLPHCDRERARWRRGRGRDCRRVRRRKCAQQDADRPAS